VSWAVKKREGAEGPWSGDETSLKKQITLRGKRGKGGGVQEPGGGRGEIATPRRGEMRHTLRFKKRRDTIKGGKLVP